MVRATSISLPSLRRRTVSSLITSPCLIFTVLQLVGKFGGKQDRNRPANDLFFTCGSSDQEIRWNYYAATQYLGQTAQDSEIVRRPLAPSQGGAFHEGGIIFQTAQDAGYQAILNWANAHGPLKLGMLDPGFAFFAHNVQPVLVKKGCMMVQCHSAAMFHDYRLRGGSGGSFSLSATRRNYTLSLAQLDLDSDDIGSSRIVRKNLYRPELFKDSTGITLVKKY